MRAQARRLAPQQHFELENMIIHGIAQLCVPAVICGYCEQRRVFYRGLRTFAHFGKGWLRRVDKIQELAMHLWAISAPSIKNPARQTLLNPLIERNASVLWTILFDIYRSL